MLSADVPTFCSVPPGRQCCRAKAHTPTAASHRPSPSRSTVCTQKMSALFPRPALGWAGLVLQPLCLPFSLAVDNILIPENRAHLSLEAQLKELLEKLDLVNTMRSSGARTRRVRMLRREINALRQKLAQPPPPQLLSLNRTVPNGELPAGSRGDAAVPEQALQEEPEDEGDRGERATGRQGAGWVVS